MAQKVDVLLLDDLDGSDADETVNFALDGIEYEIDLSEANATELRDFLDQYIGAGRKVQRNRTEGGRRRRSSIPTHTKEELDEIRAWAKERGEEVSQYGRVPERLWEQFRQERQGRPGNDAQAAAAAQRTDSPEVVEPGAPVATDPYQVSIDGQTIT